MPKLLLLLFVVTSSVNLPAQPTFQGEITYFVKYNIKKMNAYIVQYPAKHIQFIIKDGNFILLFDSAKDYEYQYFDRDKQRQYWKLRNYDTLLFVPATDAGDTANRITSTQNLKRVDTVLGRVCNRFVLRTKSMKLSLSYDPSIAVDPSWFRNAKLNAMDLIYGTMKSMYLKMVWETNDFIETATASKIQRRMVLSNEFPQVATMPAKPL
jgi:hypothetical protein